MYKQKKTVFTAVKKAIDKWNLYGLLPGAPADEFDSESRAVANKIDYVSNMYMRIQRFSVSMLES